MFRLNFGFCILPEQQAYLLPSTYIFTYRSDGEDDEEVNAGDHQGTGQVQRPGQETEEPTAQGKQGGSNRQPRPKLTYELLTVSL